MTESIETTEAEALPSLYDRTGDIKDLNTLLIPRAEYDRLLATIDTLTAQRDAALEWKNIAKAAVLGVALDSEMVALERKYAAIAASEGGKAL
jgi:hypothetical protein